MKKNFLFVGLVVLSSAAWAQNKTLGVGVATPNPNAVLHVESPTGNQGFILPRLTTAQRTAPSFLSALDGDDNGLMVYDTDERGIFIWDGTAWTSPSPGTTPNPNPNPRLVYPYADTVFSAPAGPNLFSLVYADSRKGGVGVARFENLSVTNGFPALFAKTNSALSGAAKFEVDNPSSNNDALNVTTNGVGTAGRFAITNSTNTKAAVYATTDGTGPLSSAILGETTTAFSAVTGRVTSGPSNAVSGITTSTDPGSWAGYFSASDGTALFAQTSSNVGGALAPVAVYGESVGTGSSAASFRINNSANTYAAVYAETNGSGPTALLRATNTSDPNASALIVESEGLGNVASFTGKNGSGTGAVVAATSQGQGPALQGANTSSGLALLLQSGGMRVSTMIVTSTEINSRVAAYYLQSGGPGFNFSKDVPLSEGDIFYFYNDTGGEATVGPVTIPKSEGRILIFMNKNLRSF